MIAGQLGSMRVGRVTGAHIEVPGALWVGSRRSIRMMVNRKISIPSRRSRNRTIRNIKIRRNIEIRNRVVAGARMNPNLSSCDSFDSKTGSVVVELRP